MLGLKQRQGLYSGETNVAVEIQEPCGDQLRTEVTDTSTTSPRSASLKLHTRPGRKACQTDSGGTCKKSSFSTCRIIVFHHDNMSV